MIPEVPSLGHCDYLMMGNPDIAERADDPYPDTYCPSNPKSYQILFDVIDEIIDVFEPSIMNIGHDEYYTIGVCEKCRGKSLSLIHILLSQAQGDRKILAEKLGISPHQLSYVTHSEPGEGLLFFGNTILPFVDHFPKDTRLYQIMTTRPEEVQHDPAG